MDEDLVGREREVEREPGDAAGWLRLAQARARAGAAEAALEAARRALALDPTLEPDLDDARALMRRAYVELTAEVEPPGLREAIGRALGREGPWTEPPGWTDAHLLGGAMHAASGTVAWVEDLQRETPGSSSVDCRVTLHVARGGHELLAWPLAHYNPFFGTTLHHVHTDGERVVLVYREKHRTLLALVPLEGAPSVVGVSEAHLVLPDQVVFVGRDRGVLQVRALSDLAAGLPVPAPGTVAGAEPIRLEGGELVVALEPGQARLPLPPGAPAPLLGGDEARDLALAGPLRGAPQPHADALLGAVAHPLWLDPDPPSPGYPGHGMRWLSPHWLPVYWHRHLLEADRASDAAALVRLLDGLVGGTTQHTAPTTGHAPRERLARLLAGRAAELLDAIHAGHRLPRGVRCFLWADWSIEAFTPWLERFPPGFVDVFRELSWARPRYLERAL